jgi:hypothetical protein
MQSNCHLHGASSTVIDIISEILPGSFSAKGISVARQKWVESTLRAGVTLPQTDVILIFDNYGVYKGKRCVIF